jgi:hypothetical protein
MLVVYRTRGEDWARFVGTLKGHFRELEDAGCVRVEAYRNRKHPDEWLMVQEWPAKEVFDSFAERQGPDLDRAAGWLRWKDVSTWSEGVTWVAGEEPHPVPHKALEID